MDDAAFLQQCGIEIDLRWLVECIGEDASQELCNYLKALIRIGDMLSNAQIR